MAEGATAPPVTAFAQAVELYDSVGDATRKFIDDEIKDERWRRKQDTLMKWCGHLTGSVIAIGAMVITIYLLANGHTWEGSVLMGADAVSGALVFRKARATGADATTVQPATVP
ncbi:hypothetical protein [Promicromonospora sp. NFX87]|uniref:hypothetical protein n=1 Tax=Promicromonospora sp. NFX87 TaxID=3402691 RepID=UPI003AFB21FC